MARKAGQISHEATADGSYGSIWAAITKPRNVTTTIEQSTARCGKRRYLTRELRERDLGRDLEGAKVTLNEYLDRWNSGNCEATKPRKDLAGLRRDAAALHPISGGRESKEYCLQMLPMDV